MLGVESGLVRRSWLGRGVWIEESLKFLELGMGLVLNRFGLG